jgi:hypothetical protein
MAALTSVIRHQRMAAEKHRKKFFINRHSLVFLQKAEIKLLIGPNLKPTKRSQPTSSCAMHVCSYRGILPTVHYTLSIIRSVIRTANAGDCFDDDCFNGVLL